MTKGHPGQKLKLRVAHASREFHPSEDLSELPLPGQEYQRWCCHRKTDRPRSASWTVGPASHLICRIHAVSYTGGSSRSLQCRCPFSIFTRHTNGCISVSGYALYKVQVRASSESRKSSPHYKSEFRYPLIAKNQKLPIKSKNIFSFDRILIRRLNTLFWLHPCCFAYSRSVFPSK